MSTAVVVFAAVVAVGVHWWWNQNARWTDFEKDTSSMQALFVESPESRVQSQTGLVDEFSSGSRLLSLDSGLSTLDEEDSATAESTIDFTPTSWENPFTAAHWRSQGWRFDGKSMWPSARETASATFRRNYKKLTLQCRIEPLDKPGSFQIALVGPKPNTLLKVVFSPGAVVVISEIDGRKREIRRRKIELAMAPGKPGQLRLTATGNRIIVVWNRRIILSCNQPAQQSGRQLELRLVSRGGGWRISQLRLEGE